MLNIFDTERYSINLFGVISLKMKTTTSRKFLFEDYIGFPRRLTSRPGVYACIPSHSKGRYRRI
jgi:hypothetical protein